MMKYKVIYHSFCQMLSQIKKDPMLLVSLIAPILAGVAFRYLIPFLEIFLCEQLQRKELIEPYYILFDSLLMLLAPTMFCFAAAMVILMEVDDHIANYYYVTPVGKHGYLIGRLVIPSLFGTIYSIILYVFFHLVKIPVSTMILGILVSAFMSVILSLMVVSLASNKVEGMAITKLSGMILLGILVPFFVKGKVQYITSFLPSFWLGKYMLERNIIFVFISFVLSITYIVGFGRHFLKKIIS